MSRARLAALGTLGAAALAAAGVAAASHRTRTTQSATATFSATAVSHNRTTTCVAGDGTYEDTTATYTGSTGNSSDGRLNGSLVIRAHSIVNTNSKLGWLDGSFRIRGSNGGAHGTIHAAIANGNAVGAATGTVTRPAGKLVASFVSAFSQSTGFDSGTLGTGTSISSAGTIFSRGACARTAHFAKTAVFWLRLTPGEVVSTTAASRARASGRLKLDLTRDSAGTITGAQLTFHLTYRFAGPVDITKLALYKGPKGAVGPVTADTATTATNTSRGTVTKTVTGISPTDAQALLTTPQDYYVELGTSGGALRDQLGGYRRR